MMPESVNFSEEKTGGVKVSYLTHYKFVVSPTISFLLQPSQTIGTTYQDPLVPFTCLNAGNHYKHLGEAW